MQLTDQLDALLLGLLLGQRLTIVAIVEPVVEKFRIAEYFWQQEVEQGPQLMQIILERGPRQQQFALSTQFPHNLRKLTILIFNLMSLVDNNIVPFYLFQTLETNSHPLKRCHNDIEFTLVDNVCQYLLSFVFGGD